MDDALRREADTMGFYVCVTLFVAMAAGNDQAPQPLGTLLGLIWLSTVGLALTHWMAASVAIRLVPDADGHHPTWRVLLAHVAVPVAAASSASLAVLAAPTGVRLLAGRLAAATTLAVLVAAETRRGNRSLGRAVRLGVLSFSCAAGIALLKRMVY